MSSFCICIISSHVCIHKPWVNKAYVLFCSGFNVNYVNLYPDFQLLERRSMEKADFNLLEAQLRDSRNAIDNFVKGEKMDSSKTKISIIRFVSVSG